MAPEEIRRPKAGFVEDGTADRANTLIMPEENPGGPEARCLPRTGRNPVARRAGSAGEGTADRANTLMVPEENPGGPEARCLPKANTLRRRAKRATKITTD